jgi:enoyl-CoA hydratase
MGDLLTYSLDGPVATATLDDGKANALSPDMLSELDRALDQATADSAVLVLMGRPGIFSGGFDLKVLRAGGQAAVDMFLDGFALSERMLAHPLPIVAACTGHALAMASFLLLSVDYRIGTAGDFKIGANEVAIGLAMPRYGVEICRQRLTPACFQRTVNNAELFDPEGAVAAGFLDRVVPADQLGEVTSEVATGLSALDLKAHAFTKRRTREQAIAAVHAAIEADTGDLRGALGG